MLYELWQGPLHPAPSLGPALVFLGVNDSHQHFQNQGTLTQADFP